MTSRSEFLSLLWNETINGNLNEAWIQNVIASAEKHPSEPFADVALVLERLRANGASDRDLALVARFAAYIAVFDVLYKLGDPGVDDANMLHEELLTADPSGLDGRPGSAEQVPPNNPYMDSSRDTRE